MKATKTDVKTFEIKGTEIKVENDETLNYAFFLRSALRNAPQGGMDIETMRKRMPILDKLDDIEVGEKIELTIGEVNTLKDCVKRMQWGFVHKDIITFSDHIEAL